MDDIVARGLSDAAESTVDSRHKQIQTHTLWALNQTKEPSRDSLKTLLHASHLRPAKDALHQGIQDDQPQRRSSEHLAVAVELQENPEPSGQLDAQKGNGLGRGDGPRGERSRLGPLHLFIQIAIPKIVDGAPGAPEQDGARAKEGQRAGVRQRPRRRREADGPEAGPGQQPRSCEREGVSCSGVRHVQNIYLEQRGGAVRYQGLLLH